MNRSEEASLAWALADVAVVFMHPTARAWLCAKIGAGELDSAIRDLLYRFVRDGAELPRELVVRLNDWVRGYSGTDSEADLRDLVDRVRIAVKPAEQLQPRGGTAHRQPVRLTATRRWPLPRRTSLRPATATRTVSLGTPLRIEN